MNERIKELAEQAGMTDDKFGMFFAKDFDSHCADGVDLEKFAELIVQECVRYFNEDYQRDWSTLWREDLSKKLKQHFGVKV